eukprot:scaffold206579_cov62-Attheya_sp.AAC.1
MGASFPPWADATCTNPSTKHHPSLVLVVEDLPEDNCSAATNSSTILRTDRVSSHRTTKSCSTRSFAGSAATILLLMFTSKRRVLRDRLAPSFASMVPLAVIYNPDLNPIHGHGVVIMVSSLTCSTLGMFATSD